MDQPAPETEYNYLISNQSETVCQRNKDQVTRLLNQDFSQYEEIIAEDIVAHGPASDQETRGIEAVKKVDMGYATAYPNAQYKIQEIFASGDKVVVRWSIQGTHLGERNGLRISGGTQDLLPTNQEIHVNGVHIYRFNHSGKIVESWAMWDRLGEIEQIANISLTPKIK